MMRKGLNSVVKVSICVLIVMGLLVAVSCKQSEEEEAPPTVQKQPTPSTPVVSEKPEVKEVTPPPTKVVEKTPEPVKTDDNKSGMVPLPLELPKPMFVGTPQDTKVENLEKPLGKPRPPFYAPAGVKNVAFEKPVSSTDEEPIIGEIEMITDGDKEAADGSYVELGPFKQSVTIDLEDEYEIYAVVVWHYHKQANVYFDVVVQVASDPDFISNVTTLFNNDIDNSAGLGVGKDKHYSETSEGRLIPGKGVKARYIRLYSQGNNSNDLNHYIEVEVFGK
ncbi:MAG: hypothetical protein ACYS32_14945 [Planctomycetota bacterium]|jgi:hypothetical protein